jgi:hypothetical protein
MMFGGSDKINDLQNHWTEHQGKNVTVTGTVIEYAGQRSGSDSPLCEVETECGKKIWLNIAGYVLADDTGKIVIWTCDSPNVGDEVRVTGIYHSGTVNYWSNAYSLPEIDLLSQTIIKKSSNVTIKDKIKCWDGMFGPWNDDPKNKT